VPHHLHRDLVWGGNQRTGEKPLTTAQLKEAKKQGKSPPIQKVKSKKPGRRTSCRQARRRRVKKKGRPMRQFPIVQGREKKMWELAKKADFKPREGFSSS